MKLLKYISIIFLLLILSCDYNRDYVHIVGSSSMYPVVTRLGENFSKKTGYKVPVVESVGTGGGFKLFCSGLGVRYPDVVDASRKIKDSEIEYCKKNGVTKISHKIIGHDALVLVMVQENQTVKNFDLSENELYAIFTDSNIKTWKDLNPANHNKPIVIYGPNSNSGNYEVLLEKIIHPGCKKHGVSENNCRIRADGAYIESGNNQNVMISKVEQSGQDSGVIAVIPLEFYTANIDSLKPFSVNVVLPNEENVKSNKYFLSRPLLLYFKDQHFDKIKGLKEFIEYTN